jgi:hypothetical protein
LLLCLAQLPKNFPGRLFVGVLVHRTGQSCNSSVIYQGVAAADFFQGLTEGRYAAETIP